MIRPIENAYVVPGSRLLAGEYPGSSPRAGDAVATDKLLRFLDAGIDAYVDLTMPEDGLASYIPRLRSLAEECGIDVAIDQLPILDMGVCAADHMRGILDTIDARLAEGRTVYVHCWGGIGRTGTVVGCWLVRHGRTGDEALAEVGRLYATMSPEKLRRHPESPQTPAQCAMVRTWRERDSRETPEA